MKSKSILSVVILLLTSYGYAAMENMQNNDATKITGFLLVAPDRGSDGNDKTKVVLKSLKKNFKAEVLFSVGDKTKFHTYAQIDKLLKQGVNKIVILPMFYSRHNSAYKLALRHIRLQLNRKKIKFIEAREFGKSYLAVEMLLDKIKSADISKNDKIVLTGYGADNKIAQLRMAEDFKWLLKKAKKSTWINKIALFPSWDSDNASLNDNAWQTINSAISGDKNTQIVPMHFGKELTPMMSFASMLSRGWNQRSKESMKHAKIKETDYTTYWANREANRFSAVENNKVGLLFLAHGSDYYWNETMRNTMSNLSKKIPIEFSFSMADNSSITRAIKRLEDRGVGAIVIVRVFGMGTSFIGGINRLIGADIENMHNNMAMGSGAMSMMMGAKKRVKTKVMITTTGGLDDDFLFASALLDKVKQKSKNPSKETIILLAHGYGNDNKNAQWMNVLASIATQMKALDGGDKFRDIKFQTWREDWPLKRVERINSVKSMIKKANKNGGKAILVASRTTGTGPSDELLGNIRYIKATGGFAPHPLFNKWIEKQFNQGKSQIKYSRMLMSKNSGQFETTDKGELRALVYLMNKAISENNKDMLFKLFAKDALRITLFSAHDKSTNNKTSATDLRKSWDVLFSILSSLKEYQREAMSIKINQQGNFASAWVQVKTRLTTNNTEIKASHFSEVITFVKKNNRWKIVTISNNYKGAKIN